MSLRNPEIKRQIPCSGHSIKDRSMKCEVCNKEVVRDEKEGAVLCYECEANGWKEEKCFNPNCGRYFWSLNWHEPPSCPKCRRSRVD